MIRSQQILRGIAALPAVGRSPLFRPHTFAARLIPGSFARKHLLSAHLPHCGWGGVI